VINKSDLLFIEPSAKISKEPVIDRTTKKMTAALRLATKGPGYRGVHQCACGVYSHNCNYFLAGEETTNSLCVHYLAFHRDEVPPEQIERVMRLGAGEANPTGKELQRPESPRPRPKYR
jgi:hypothetical protein